MALFDTLLNYKKKGLIKSFDMLESQRSKVYLNDGRNIIIFMSDVYIIGDAIIQKAVSDEPPADYMIYNNWDRLTKSAYEFAEEHGIEIHKFGAFAYKLADNEV